MHYLEKLSDHRHFSGKLEYTGYNVKDTDPEEEQMKGFFVLENDKAQLQSVTSVVDVGLRDCPSRFF